MNELEKLFKSDIREKKRIGSGIFSRVSTRKGGTNQALKTPYLYMSNKEKKLLNSEEVIYSMKDIISLEEFNQKDESMQYQLLKTWREHYSMDDIAIQMNVESAYMTELFNKFNIPMVRGKRYRPMNGTIKLRKGFKDLISNGLSFEDFRKYDVATQSEIIYRLLIMYNNSTKKMCNDYFKIPVIRYIVNLKSRATYKKVEAKYKGRDIIDEESNGRIENTVDEIKEEEELQPRKPLISEPEPEKIEIELDTNEPLINKDESKTDLNVSISGLQFKINGVQKRETLARRLQFIVDELLSDDADELMFAKISIGSLEE